MRAMSGVPQNIAALTATIAHLQRSHDQLLLALSNTVGRSLRDPVDVTEVTWDNYRTRAWPLTPWLVGLRETHGLPGLTVNWLGKRAIIDRDSRGDCEDAWKEARREIGRLVGDTSDWAREEIRACGVFA